MSKCEGGKDAGSVVLERPLRLWSVIIDSVRCGGGVQRPNRKNAEAKKQPGSDKLSELLKQPEWWENEEEVRRKEQVLEGLKKVAKKLQQEEGSMEVILEGAAEVRTLTKDDPESRTTLALLGVIPPLVALLGAIDPTFHSQIAALYALLNLAITNDANKAAIVKAGAVHKMLKLIQSPNNQAIAEAVVANFLGLSALDSNKPIIGSSGAIPFLVETLKDADGSVSGQAKQDSLRALYNLSISPSNVCAMVETDLIPHLFTKLGDMDANVLNWTDSPECQEKASYILMVMAHKSYGDRQAMIEAGIVSSLLELTLLGSLLSQKRASRMLECLRVEKGKQATTNYTSTCNGGTATVSAPLSTTTTITTASSEDDEMMSEEKKAVKQLVQQSLNNNMKRMVKRANLPHHDFVPSDRFKSLTSSSTSKSLPF
ncbi:hypothetical protein DH2020_001946 [Rehmannia glutinosa]|uniref:U-box domain-containing protein n=1 Tax=Rehmannia glutinosa TaxID=99300 RepID=A0ABR0XSU0_REHGL